MIDFAGSASCLLRLPNGERQLRLPGKPCSSGRRSRHTGEQNRHDPAVSCTWCSAALPERYRLEAVIGLDLAQDVDQISRARRPFIPRINETSPP